MFLFACIVDIGEYADINDDINNDINSSNIADTNEVSTNKLDEVKTHEAINEYDDIGEYDDINDDINNDINSSNIADTNEVSTNKLDEVKTHEAINEYDGVEMIQGTNIENSGPNKKIVFSGVEINHMLKSRVMRSMMKSRMPVLMK
ncbi:uncharacterized protein LOC132736649 isoform X1 [Ruditapes philippinarum]|uniref:uncharacterized protein LOC132736649 isoform X1 n=1 Tax=Ruditapes philippinarum TaxID=129788 RepID=UPI00295C3398|nr:uncharacterized protein LOC132736649 isoform X1 [Ruditapes philippinarum]